MTTERRAREILRRAFYRGLYGSQPTETGVRGYVLHPNLITREDEGIDVPCDPLPYEDGTGVTFDIAEGRAVGVKRQ
jgi:hypothetical protein